MASLILGTIGTALGGPVGGFIGSAIGSYIDAYLFAPTPPDVEGPRLSDLDSSAADVGTPLPKTWGCNRVGGFILHTSDIIETKNVEEKDAGGKQTYEETTYTYSITTQLCVNDGAILGVGRIWADGKIMRGFESDYQANTQTYRYNAGGLDYPAYFRDRIYDPELIPWNLDPAAHGATADRWTLNTATGALVPGSKPFEDIGGTRPINYWQHPVTGYYFPEQVELDYNLSIASVKKYGDILTFAIDTILQGEPFSYLDVGIRKWGDYYNLFAALNDFGPWGILQLRKCDDIKMYRGTDDQPSDTTMSTLAGETVPAYRNRANIVLENLQLEDYANRLPSLTFEVIRYEDESPQSIVTDIMTNAGVGSEFYSLSGLPTTGLKSFVPGFSINRRTNYRKAIETVISAFNIDAAEIGPEIIFRPRERTADHVIQYDELAAHDAGNRETAEQLTYTKRDVVTLPRIIEVQYIDIERDYQDGTQRAFRTQTTNTHLASVEVPLVMYPYFMKQWTQNKLQEMWSTSRSVEFSLPPKYVFVSPSDTLLIVTDKIIGTDGGTPIVASFTVKVTRLRKGVNGIIEVNGVVLNSALYPADDYDDFSTENNYVSYTNYQLLENTVMNFLDIPPINAGDVLYGFYVGFSDWDAADWPGVTLLQSTDGAISYNPIASTGQLNPFGEVTTGQLSSAPNSSTITYNDVIVVTLYTGLGSLSSITDDELLTLNNLCMIGDEIICFRDVVSLGNRQFQISGPMIRGLKDTDGVTHGANEKFSMLNDTLVDYGASLENRNRLLDYKPVTSGVSEASTDNEQYTHTGARFRPFKPITIDGSRVGNNLTITWVRQDRLYSAWPDNSDLLNSEIDEIYQVDILDGVTVVRTIEVSEPTASYSAAEQSADGLTPGDPVDVKIYQMSTTVGRGNAGVKTV